MTRAYNIILYLAQGVFLAYDVTYFHSAGLSLALISLASSGFDLSSVISEFPTSVLFDKVSPRVTLIFGNIVRAAGFILFACFPRDFILVLIGQVLTGIGSATESGAASALYVNAKKTSGSSFEKILGELAESIGIATVLGGCIGALAYRWDQRLIWIIPACLYVVAMVLLLFIPMGKNVKKVGTKTLLNDFVAICRKSLGIPDWWIAICVDAGALSIFYLWQMRLSESGGKAVWNQLLGLLAMNLGSALGGFLGRKLQCVRGTAIPLLIVLNIVSCVLFAWIPGLVVGLTLFCIHVTLQTWVLNHYYGHIHGSIRDDERATVFSFLSMVNAVIAFVMGPISGWLADAYGVGVGMGASLFLYVIPIVLYSKNRGNVSDSRQGA